MYFLVSMWPGATRVHVTLQANPLTFNNTVAITFHVKQLPLPQLNNKG